MGFYRVKRRRVFQVGGMTWKLRTLGVVAQNLESARRQARLRATTVNEWQHVESCPGETFDLIVSGHQCERRPSGVGF